jgi:hypothetical protein
MMRNNDFTNGTTSMRLEQLLAAAMREMWKSAPLPLIGIGLVQLLFFAAVAIAEQLWVQPGETASMQIIILFGLLAVQDFNIYGPRRVLLGLLSAALVAPDCPALSNFGLKRTSLGDAIAETITLPGIVALFWYFGIRAGIDVGYQTLAVVVGLAVFLFAVFKTPAVFGHIAPGTLPELEEMQVDFDKFLLSAVIVILLLGTCLVAVVEVGLGLSGTWGIDVLFAPWSVCCLFAGISALIITSNLLLTAKTRW